MGGERAEVDARAFGGGDEARGAEHVHERGPVHAVRAVPPLGVPPVAGAGLLVVAEGDAQGAQDARGLPRLGDGDVVVRVAVQDREGGLAQVGEEGGGVAGRTCAAEHRGHLRVRARHVARVGVEAEPSRAGCGGGERPGEERGELPGAVPAHAVPRDPGLQRVGGEPRARHPERLHRVQAPPVLPVEPERAPVRRRDDVQEVLRGVAGGLAEALDRGAVQGEEQPLSRAGPGAGVHGVVLHAAVDGASERPLVRAAGVEDGEVQGPLVVGPGGAAAAQLEVERPGGLVLGGCGGAQVEGHLARLQGTDVRQARRHAFVAIEVRGDPRAADPLLRRVDDDGRARILHGDAMPGGRHEGVPVRDEERRGGLGEPGPDPRARADEQKRVRSLDDLHGGAHHAGPVVVPGALLAVDVHLPHAGCLEKQDAPLRGRHPRLQVERGRPLRGEAVLPRRDAPPAHAVPGGCRHLLALLEPVGGIAKECRRQRVQHDRRPSPHADGGQPEGLGELTDGW